MPNIDRYLPESHPFHGHAGHALLYDAYMATDLRDVDGALLKLGDAMKSFGWDRMKNNTENAPYRRCWREWIGMAARVRGQTLDLVACGALAYTTTEQALLDDLEQLYVDATAARRAEVEPKQHRRK